MTDLIPRYEETGPLTVCPCCGQDPQDRSHGRVCCLRCWKAFSHAFLGDPDAKYRPMPDKRAWWAAYGVELRREGKRPPLKEAERWGVWADAVGGWTQHVRASEVPCSCHVQHPGSFHEMRGTRAEAEAFATYARRYGRSYTVKPYPDAKQTPVLPPYDCGVHPPEEACACRGRAIAEPAKVDQCEWHQCEQPSTSTRTDIGGTVFRMCAEHAAEGDRLGYNRDPYATHRLAGERRRTALMVERGIKAEHARILAERIAVIDAELARLDKPR